MSYGSRQNVQEINNVGVPRSFKAARALARQTHTHTQKERKRKHTHISIISLI